MPPMTSKTLTLLHLVGLEDALYIITEKLPNPQEWKTTEYRPGVTYYQWLLQGIETIRQELQKED